MVDEGGFAVGYTNGTRAFVKRSGRSLYLGRASLGPVTRWGLAVTCDSLGGFLEAARWGERHVWVGVVPWEFVTSDGLRDRSDDAVSNIGPGSAAGG